MTTRRTTPSRRSAPKRGMSLIETIAAVVLLAIIASMVLGTVSSLIAQQVRQQRRTEAVELANRLMLQYLDDPYSMPQKGLPVAYGKERYRWDFDEQATSLRPARVDVAAERAQRSSLVVDRIKAVTIRVWLGEESGGAHDFTSAQPNAVLTRLVDPIAVYRNPDSMTNAINDDARKAEWLAQFRPAGQGGLVTRTGGATVGSGSKDDGPLLSSPPPPRANISGTRDPNGAKGAARGGKGGGKGGNTSAGKGSSGSGGTRSTVGRESASDTRSK